MRTESILTALKVAETGGVTETANQLFLDQCTVTDRLQDLEKELGFALFIRTKNKFKPMVPTEQGKKWLAMAGKLLSLLDKGTAEIKRGGDVRVRAVRVRKGDGL